MKSPDYRYRVIEMVQDGLECLSCDSTLSEDNRRLISQALRSLMSVKFSEYPRPKHLRVVE